jgi:hypothetical protein
MEPRGAESRLIYSGWRVINPPNISQAQKCFRKNHGLNNPEGMLIEDSAEIRDTSGLHFQNIYAEYPLADQVSEAWPLIDKEEGYPDSLLRCGLWSSE